MYELGSAAFVKYNVLSCDVTNVVLVARSIIIPSCQHRQSTNPQIV